MNATETFQTRPARQRGRGRTTLGFTLVELVVTLAIVGILASASYGSYSNYLVRTNRSATQQFMIDVLNRQELYLLDARAYTTDIGNTGLGMTIPDKVSNHYNVAITLSAGPPPGFVITASPSGTQTDDGVLSLASDGTRLPLSKWAQ